MQRPFAHEIRSAFAGRLGPSAASLTQGDYPGRIGGAVHFAVRCQALNPTNKWVPSACFQASQTFAGACTRAGRRELPGIQCWFK